jgi:hypothetical protein
MTAERKVRDFLVSECSYDIDQSLETLIPQLQKDKRRYEKEGWSDLRFDLDEGPYDDRRSVYLRGKRLETQAEADKRFEAEERQRVQREAYERRQYEALREKFEGQP